jgi:hypothetical protein
MSYFSKERPTKADTAKTKLETKSHRIARNRRIKILYEHRLVAEQATYGNNVKIFVLTERGKMLSKLIGDLEKVATD